MKLVSRYRMPIIMEFKLNSTHGSFPHRNINDFPGWYAVCMQLLGSFLRKTMEYSKIFDPLFDLFCLIGLIWQTVEVSVLYFQYDVVTRVATDVPSYFPVPSLHSCIRYTDIVDFKKVNTALRTNWTFDPENWDAMLRMQRELTVRQIFDFTPGVESSINRCILKRPKSYEVLYRPKDECFKIFNVTKYVALEYVCYKYDYRPSESDVNPVSVSLDTLAYTVKSPGEVYSIIPGKEFANFIVSKFLVTNPGKFPHVSIGLAPLLERKNLLDFGSYTINFFSLTKNHLPAPYRTNCFDYS